MRHGNFLINYEVNKNGCVYVFVICVGSLFQSPSYIDIITITFEDLRGVYRNISIALNVSKPPEVCLLDSFESNNWLVINYYKMGRFMRVSKHDDDWDIQHNNFYLLNKVKFKENYHTYLKGMRTIRIYYSK